jgi:uncharacterized protein YjbI with pentapeptide repeats
LLWQEAVANPEHLAKLKESVEAWNQWRKSNPSIQLDLREADLSHADLSEANLNGAYLSKANLLMARLRGAYFSGANLNEANLRKANLLMANLGGADLSGADLSGADLNKANLTMANLSGANLSEANLSEAKLNMANLSRANLTDADLNGADLNGAILNEANLSEADLSGANLSLANLSDADLNGADLRAASLVGSDLRNADLTGCRVYGISVWNAKLDGAKQSNLIVTPEEEPAIQIDNLEVAQFVYLLLNNAKIRQVIDTIGKKAVLILGRFTPGRKAILDSIRDALRQLGFLPMLFDFESPSTRDTQETIVTLASLSRFIIADITDPKSIPQELALIVPTLPSVPVQPLLQAGCEPWGMYDHIKRFPWVLPLVEYENQQALLRELEPKVIVPAEAKAKEQTRK